MEVRCGFGPSFLSLRWQLRLGRKFEPKLLEPPERIFTHDRAADTLSFYIQGELAAAPPKNNDGRPGDTRLVFWLFQDKDRLRPAVLGMFPKWRGKGRPSPMSYTTSLIFLDY